MGLRNTWVVGPSCTVALRKAGQSVGRWADTVLGDMDTGTKHSTEREDLRMMLARIMALQDQKGLRVGRAEVT